MAFSALSLHVRGLGPARGAGHLAAVRLKNYQYIDLLQTLTNYSTQGDFMIFQKLALDFMFKVFGCW